MNGTLRYNLFALLSPIFAAMGWILTEIIIKFYAVPPIWTIVLSNAIGGMMLLLLSSANPGRGVMTLDRTGWIRIVMAGFVMYGAGFLLGYITTGLIGSGKSTLLGLTQSPMMVILAIIFLHEKLATKHWIAGSLVLMGAILINFNLDGFSFDVGWGELLGIVSSLCISVGVIIITPVMTKANKLQVVLRPLCIWMR